MQGRLVHLRKTLPAFGERHLIDEFDLPISHRAPERVWQAHGLIQKRRRAPHRSRSEFIGRHDRDGKPTSLPAVMRESQHYSFRLPLTRCRNSLYANHFWWTFLLSDGGKIMTWV